jgi:hypothetical protein
MSVEAIGLGKLLKAMYADRALQTKMLREDIRAVIQKESGAEPGDGGDFYGPFWADAKHHVSGELDLRKVTLARIAKSKQRTKLYKLLSEGFLTWWEEKRRLRNEPFTVIGSNVKARHKVGDIGVVKVENTLCFTIGDDGHRILCPYFAPEPALSDEAARLGLWLMSQCIKSYELKDMRLLDVFRGRSFSVIETPLLGNEEELFEAKYQAVVDRWAELRSDYD